MCNLIAFIGKEKESLPCDLTLKTLMLIGDNLRGGDGTGVVGGYGKDFFQVRSGDFKTSHGRYESMVTDAGEMLHEYVDTIDNGNVVLIHNRKKSSGGYGVTHPFVYGEDGDDNQMVFMHNGTVRNIDLIWDKYKPDIVKTAVDSKVMGRIIYENGHEVLPDLLTEYTGAANFIWYYPNIDNSVHVYRGDAAIETNIRPLYWSEDKYGWYLNSLKNPLISVNLNTVKEFPKGQVMHCNRDGAKILYKIGARKPLVKPVFVNKVAQLPSATISKNRSFREYNKGSKTVTKKKSKLTHPQSRAKGKVYWHHDGKYYINGHIMRGKYFVDDEGNSINLVMLNQTQYGTYYNKGYVIHRFVDGVLVKDEAAFIARNGQSSYNIRYEEYAYGQYYVVNTKIKYKDRVSGQLTYPSGIIRPFLAQFDYKVHGGEIVQQFELPNKFTKLLIQEFNEEFSFSNDTKLTFKTLIECVEHFKKWDSTLCWADCKHQLEKEVVFKLINNMKNKLVELIEIAKELQKLANVGSKSILFNDAVDDDGVATLNGVCEDIISNASGIKIF